MKKYLPPLPRSLRAGWPFPGALLLAASAMLSCQKEQLPVQTSYPFRLSSDPIPQQVYLQDSFIRIRLYLDKSASFNPTTYAFSYYLLQGRGALSDTEQRVFYEVNTDYLFRAHADRRREVWHFRYRPTDTTQTSITFIVRSDHGQADTLNYDFQIAY